MSFLRVHLFTLIYDLFLHLGFCKAYQNCLVALIKITTVLYIYFGHNGIKYIYFPGKTGILESNIFYMHEG